jgi:orotidine-5'-phosphate decarboxylase
VRERLVAIDEDISNKSVATLDQGSKDGAKHMLTISPETPAKLGAMSEFTGRLDAAATRNQSLVCVGLDPWGPSMPTSDIAAFTKAIIDATSDLVCAYKPNFAFFEAEGIEGLRALEATMKAVPSGVPVILDAKRGDIGSTATAYAKAAFEVWGADAVTVNPYMGADTLEPFLAYEDRGVFVLTRTSNPGGRDFEELEVSSDGETRPLYEHVTERAVEWNSKGNIGLVVGATAPDELRRIREIAPAMPILIPGIGTQGGDLQASIRYGMNAQGLGAVINSSRGIIFAGKGPNFADAARAAADKLRSEINVEREKLGFRWRS